ncbi:MAG: hypothetical protein GWN53_17110 [Gammaproteobacteria bacterium]|uniref:Uncharacterized protein n=1 Tax=Candidatus Kutchimonas denitrificans TaxID=3056748 RepID=A0AAE4ZDN1_9BACT|nr:hypothetical protein [Candidatus Kutchimonas denitrificans]NIV53561.1 hypothetical protein [Gammaproteobacteria bacterium]
MSERDDMPFGFNISEQHEIAERANEQIRLFYTRRGWTPIPHVSAGMVLTVLQEAAMLKVRRSDE